MEEHGSFGGLLSSLIEFAYKNNYNTSNIINKIYEPTFSFVGNQKNARKKIGLDKNMVVRKFLKRVVKLIGLDFDNTIVSYDKAFTCWL